MGTPERAEHFLALHEGDPPLLLPNPWDLGSARLFEWMGFEALATTSSGFAATFGRRDGAVGREEALAHAAEIAAATWLPVSADLENGYADDPAAVAETIRMARDAGLAGASIEDYSGDESAPIYDIGLARERVAAAAEAAREGDGRLVLTARAENHLYGAGGLDDTIARLQAYEEAGADVLYAPGLLGIDEVRAVVEAVGRPVNFLARPKGPTVAELAEAGVGRVSVGGAFAFAALGAAVEAGRELIDLGTYEFWKRASVGLDAARAAFPSS